MHEAPDTARQLCCTFVPRVLSVLSIFKPSTSFAALSHNICFVMGHINHHQRQPARLRLRPPPTAFILDSFINAIESHLQRSQPQVGSKWVARCNWYGSMGRAPYPANQPNRQARPQYPPNPTHTQPNPYNATAKCEVNIAPGWRAAPATCSSLKGNLR